MAQDILTPGTERLHPQGENSGEAAAASSAPIDRVTGWLRKAPGVGAALVAAGVALGSTASCSDGNEQTCARVVDTTGDCDMNGNGLDADDDTTDDDSDMGSSGAGGANGMAGSGADDDTNNADDDTSADDDTTNGRGGASDMDGGVNNGGNGGLDNGRGGSAGSSMVDGGADVDGGMNAGSGGMDAGMGGTDNMGGSAGTGGSNAGAGGVDSMGGSAGTGGSNAGTGGVDSMGGSAGTGGSNAGAGGVDSMGGSAGTAGNGGETTGGTGGAGGSGPEFCDGLERDCNPDPEILDCKDIWSDPDNCGICGNQCPSGMCTFGACDVGVGGAGGTGGSGGAGGSTSESFGDGLFQNFPVASINTALVQRFVARQSSSDIREALFGELTDFSTTFNDCLQDDDCRSTLGTIEPGVPHVEEAGVVVNCMHYGTPGSFVIVRGPEIITLPDVSPSPNELFVVAVDINGDPVELHTPEGDTLMTPFSAENATSFRIEAADSPVTVCAATGDKQTILEL